MIIIPANSPSTAYTLQKSLRFRASASANLTRTFTTPTSSTVFTWSGWVKRGLLGTTQYLFGASTTTNFGFNSSNQLVLTLSGTTAATTSGAWTDPSGWYHVVYVQNGSAQTIYVNSISKATGTTANTVFNTAIAHQTASANSANYFDGYLAEVNFIDGQALTPTSFGSFNATTGVWQPAKYSGTYGTNGFYLPFSNTASTTTLGYDLSGNSNNWTTNNIGLATGSAYLGVSYDAMTDVPTLTSAAAGNYAVLNPLDTVGTTVISAANSTITGNQGIFWQTTRATIALPSSGKFYWEAGLASSQGDLAVGIATFTAALVSNIGTNMVSYIDTGTLINNGTSTGVASFAIGDQIGIAVDVGANLIYFYKNNVLVNTVGTSIAITAPFAPFISLNQSGCSGYINFGQRPFQYTPPTGFVALNAYNLPTGTILQGNKYMDATLYTGNNATGRLITNASGFQPDLVWIKDRTTAYNNNLYDSNRGAPYELSSNLTSAESSGDLTAFNTSGFTINQTSSYNINVTGDAYVAWQWQAGKGTTSSNTNGSITSIVSVNATAGFSVQTWTGNGGGTVGHGLGVVPNFIICKSRNTTSTLWWTYHSSAPGQYFYLNSTSGANADGGSVFGNNSVAVAPTSSVFSVGSSNGASGYTMVSYTWAAIAGFSSFGSYTGNGSTSGPFVYTGFQPRYILIKRTDSTSDWYVWDTARNTYNTGASYLLTDSSNAEATSSTVNTLANGFNIVNASTVNASGGTYIYAAFASNPFKNSLAF